ncbi:uncharacterized protein LOC128473020 [Spea bombifrons]|uniref:uncharacterized protein LOC128473020 n=1 Tax=Spea bombifrons TaxID=233779 RepID=UPI002349E847|nr:uncharacterized protein LOC128473020 [Spea bombifrons]
MQGSTHSLRAAKKIRSFSGGMVNRISARLQEMAVSDWLQQSQIQVHGIAVSLLLLPWAPCKGVVPQSKDGPALSDDGCGSMFGPEKSSVPTVTAVLHGTAVLPCSVSFISGTEGLLVSWAKKIGTKPSLVLLAFYKGQFDLKDQAPQYRGRTNMSPDLPNGKLDLTLTHVEHPDEGVFVCHVTHPASYRDIEVRLTVIESGTSGGDRGRRGLWISVGLLCTAGVLLGCYIFYRRRSSSAEEVHSVIEVVPLGPLLV